MPDSYWIKNRGKSYGPYSTENLQQLAARGQFSSAFQISEDGVTWQHASEFPEFFSEQAQDKSPTGEPEPTPDGAGDPPSKPVGSSGDHTQADDSWRYVVNGNPSDPMSFLQLQQLISAGVVSSDDLVWNESMPNWVRAQDVPGLVPEPLRIQSEKNRQEQLTHPAKAAPLSQFAIVSFVCGAIGVTSAPLYGVLALIFGYISLNSRHVRDGSLRGRGLAITGISTGWVCVVILILIVVLALAYPGHFEALSATRYFRLF